MRYDFILFIVSLILAALTSTQQVRAAHSSSSSGSFDWRALLQFPAEETTEEQELTSPSKLTKAGNQSQGMLSNEVKSFSKAGEMNSIPNTKKAGKESATRKKPRGFRYQKEKERIAKLAPDEQIRKKMTQVGSQKRYRAKIKGETGFSSKKAAYQGELFRLYRLGETTDEQARELEIIRAERKLRRDKSLKNRLAKLDKTKP
ncbi:uncharacterized protein FA14DRAFT_181922 [Meira miltonrushii]|uniref:Uncharacterized protein n=1 Tax=Meira miltonrushii TaxID=1280837 RepID=A0A316V716_9BASI|nr:uncharacterized protein FA14DRAFT_181922 [Meira miltonrushii]PWN32003.1 hypothetical protein FA14DRAFT_181922 [Meira miltonrushii]